MLLDCSALLWVGNNSAVQRVEWKYTKQKKKWLNT